MFNIAVTTELQFSVCATSHCPTEVFWGDRACSRYGPVLLLLFLSSFIVTETEQSEIPALQGARALRVCSVCSPCVPLVVTAAEREIYHSPARAEEENSLYLPLNCSGTGHLGAQPEPLHAMQMARVENEPLGSPEPWLGLPHPALLLPGLSGFSPEQNLDHDEKGQRGAVEEHQCLPRSLGVSCLSLSALSTPQANPASNQSC